ncbi:MAG: RHS repeat-associated core domain-containing protein, partial [Spirochaetales bacterium]|nr:RHS repeat-associated core domain-containing protein [Spirochaetales bacterium]
MCGQYKGLDYYYFNARWYDASTGRFISEDPARDGSNWHVYVSNNPLSFVDPTGLAQVKGSQADDEEKERREQERKEKEAREAREKAEKEKKAKEKYEEIISNNEYDPDRREKLLENAQECDPNFNDNFNEALSSEDPEAAIKALLEESFTDFSADGSAPLLTQFDSFLQGEPELPYSFGGSGSLLGYGTGLSISNSGELIQSDYFSPFVVVGGSLDFSVGSGNTEVTYGFDRHLSVGVRFREDYKGRSKFGGVSFHLGKSIS